MVRRGAVRYGKAGQGKEILFMIKASELELMEMVYSFVSDDGENIHIATTRLLAWCEENEPEIVVTPIEAKVAVQFIQERAVSRERCAWFLSHREELVKPIIVGEADRAWRGSQVLHYLIDGHHRYVVYATLRIPLIKTHILTRDIWTQFQISGIPDISKEQLIDSCGIAILKEVE
jgi:hypothetical protein